MEEKNRIELLCNAICPPGCPNRKKHYLLNGNFMISGGQSYGINCLIDKNILHPELLNSKNNISPEKIEEWYLLNNFHNFKLEGRTLSDITLIGIYAYYLVKKEY